MIKINTKYDRKSPFRWKTNSCNQHWKEVNEINNSDLITLAQSSSCVEPSLAFATGPTMYFHTSKGHMTWIIKKVNSIHTHCGVAYESLNSFVRGHMIRVCDLMCKASIKMNNPYDIIILNTRFKEIQEIQK